MPFDRGTVPHGKTLTQSRETETIELEQDLDFQRKSWTVQRVSWVLMLLIVVAALLGAFGDGPLSKVTAGDAQTLSVEYDRFLRVGTSAKLSVTLGTSAPESPSAALWLDRDWLSGNEVKSIVPEPDSTTVAADRVTYYFSTEPGGIPSKIEFDLKTKALGATRGKAGVVGGPVVTFAQFSYP